MRSTSPSTQANSTRCSALTGAGKTTTLRMVAGLLRPDAGSVHVLGIDALENPVAAKQVMAWVSDEPMI